MTINAGVGRSYHHNPLVAGREAALQALTHAGITIPDFVFVFATVGYDQAALIRAIRQTTGYAPLTGCSGEGIITGDEADEGNFSVVVMAIGSDERAWRNGIARGLKADSHAVGQRVASDLQRSMRNDAVGLFVFPDGLTV